MFLTLNLCSPVVIYVQFRLHMIIDNRPTEKGLEMRNFLAISHFGVRYDHMVYKWR